MSFSFPFSTSLLISLTTSIYIVREESGASGEAREEQGEGKRGREVRRVEWKVGRGRKRAYAGSSARARPPLSSFLSQDTELLTYAPSSLHLPHVERGRDSGGGGRNGSGRRGRGRRRRRRKR
jgi:hypothetical protein